MKNATTSRLEDDEAITYARSTGEMLSKYGDPVEGPRYEDVTPDEAEDIMRAAQGLIYIDVEQDERDGGQ